MDGPDWPAPVDVTAAPPPPPPPLTETEPGGVPALEAGDEQPEAGVYSIGDRGQAADVEGTPAFVVGGQPDALVDAGEVTGPDGAPSLAVRLASVRGAGHRYDGTPRQDDAGLAVAGPDGDWLVVAVADGVSAGARSHLAARAAVRVGLKLLTGELAGGADPAELDWEGLVGRLAGQVLLVARRELGDDQLGARDAARTMASTVALAVVATAPDPGDGHHRAVVVPIGDTSAWVLRGGTAWEPITAVKNEGEAVASSATVALPLLPAAIPVAAATFGPGDALLVMSDGVGDPLGDGTGEAAATLARWWADPPSRWAFASQVDFGRRSHSDDRSAVAVWPLGGVGGGPAR
ncbi:MAG: protein phosphatase 2C domain-containing protein [Acidimicrobiales bacterium]